MAAFKRSRNSGTAGYRQIWQSPGCDATNGFRRVLIRRAALGRRAAASCCAVASRRLTGGGRSPGRGCSIMRAGRSAAAELSTLAAGGTPWKGRLRSHHTTPQSFLGQRLPSQTNNLGEEEDLQTLKKQSAPKKTVRGCHARAVRQSLRLGGRHSEHPIVIDNEVNVEYKVCADQSAITVLRRSPRFHVEDKSLGKPLLPPNRLETPPNRKSKSAHLKDKNQESLKSDRRNAELELLARMKRQNEPQLLCQDLRGITPRKNIADVSNKKSEKKELMPTNCKVLTGKRKRGTKRRLSSKKKSCQEPKPLPTNCQEIAPCDEPRKSIHRRIEKEPSIVVKPKSGDEELTNIGTEREGVGKLCSSDDWTKEQDMALRKAYFTARPSPHFWKRVSKLLFSLYIICFSGSFISLCQGDLLKTASTEFMLTSRHQLQ